MKSLKVLATSATCLSLAGCGIIGGDSFGLGKLFGDGGASASGLPYRASLSRGEDRRDFTVSVVAGDATVSEARESTRFPATRYCIETYGASDIDWVIDPATGDWAFSRTGDAMVFSGRCTAR